MEKKIFFYNETKVTDKNFKLLMFYNKFFYYRNITILKLAICIFIIVGSTILIDVPLFNKAFYILVAIVGIVDTFQVKQTRLDSVTTLKYEFFDDYFKLNNCDLLFEISYDTIRYVIDAKKYYYLVVFNSLVMIDKAGFTVGNEKEIKKFIYDKRKASIN